MAEKPIKTDEMKQALKERGIMLIFVVILLVGNLSSFFVKYGVGINGSVINDYTGDLSALKFQALAFLIQWGIICGILIIAARHARPIDVQSSKIDASINLANLKPVKKAFTDIDDLYTMLQKKRNVKISEIAESFKINKDKALEWGKILENHELATIHYHVFGEAEIGLYEGEE